MKNKYWQIWKTVLYCLLVTFSIIHALQGDYPRACYDLVICILMEVT